MAAVGSSSRNEESDLDALCALAQQSTGIQLGIQKRDMVRSRLGKRLRDLGLATFGDYVRFVKGDKNGEEFAMMIDLLTTNKTSFFREARHFDVLSDLLARAHDEITLWSAGCSSGEEPYTMAAVAVAGETRGRPPARILATDLSRRMLEIARAARYRPDALDPSVAPPHRVHFSMGRDGQLNVSPALRNRVSFARLNLLGDWPMHGPFTAIFCRNVMIYFDKETRERLVARFHSLLAPGGLLFVGLAESLSGLRHDYELVEPGVYAP